MIVDPSLFRLIPRDACGAIRPAKHKRLCQSVTSTDRFPSVVLACLFVACFGSMNASAQSRGLTPVVEPGDVTAASMGPRNRVAVCIGINSVPNNGKYGPLQYAAGDAESMASTLLSHCDFDRVMLHADQWRRNPPSTNNLIATKQVDSQSIRSSVEEFINENATGKDDLILFYFAGHADREPGRYPVLITPDYPNRSLPITSVYEWLNGPLVNARHKAVILDACRSGPNLAGHVLSPGLRQTLNHFEDDLVIVSACDANESAIEDPGLAIQDANGQRISLGHGRFTWSFVRGVRGKAFGPSRSEVNISDLFTHVEETFDASMWGNQRPRLFASTRRFFVVARQHPPPNGGVPNVVAGVIQSLQDEGLELYLAERLDEARQKYDQCVDLLAAVRGDFPYNRSALFAERAVVLFRLGASKDADQSAARARRLGSDELALREFDGYELFGEMDYARAFAELQPVVTTRAQENTTAHLWAVVAVCAKELTRRADAAHYFSTAASLAVERGLIEDAKRYLHEAAKLYSALGNHQKLYELLQQTLELVESNQTGEIALDDQSELLGQIAILMAQQPGSMTPAAKGEAIRVASLAVSNWGAKRGIGYARALGNAALVEARLGESLRAEAKIEEALETYGENAWQETTEYAKTLRLASENHLLLGNRDQAIVNLEQALAVLGRLQGESSATYAQTQASLRALQDESNNNYTWPVHRDQIVIWDEPAHNGERSIVDTVAGIDDFATLSAALKAAGLVETLSDGGLYTVFAPTNEAFEKLPQGTIESLLQPENKEKLIAVLRNHIIPGKVMASSIVDLEGTKSVTGSNIDIRVNDGTVMVGSAKVIKTDVPTANGVIHVVDAVILPQ